MPCRQKQGSQKKERIKEMGRWGDDIDEELQQRKAEFKVGFMFSFKSMNTVIEKIEDETSEWDDKHPKKDLMKIWFNVMVIFLVLLCFTYSVIALATLFFFFFYGFVIIRLFGAWKRFGYSKAGYWLMTVLGFIVNFVISYFVKGLIFG